jgi:hypothetical protein
MRFGRVAVAVLFAPLVLARADDIVSGPEKGVKTPALSVFDATGPNKDKEVDYVAERKDKPTVVAFVQADQFDRPMNRFLKELDKAVRQDFPDVYVVAVWLTDDVDKTKEKLPRVQQSVQYEATALTCFTGDKTGPKGWNVNADARLTVVLTNHQKVATAFAYKSVNETDVKAVREALKKAIDGK